MCAHVDPSNKKLCLGQCCWDMRLLNLSMRLLLLGEYLATARVACVYDCKNRGHMCCTFS